VNTRRFKFLLIVCLTTFFTLVIPNRQAGNTIMVKPQAIAGGDLITPMLLSTPTALSVDIPVATPDISITTSTEPPSLIYITKEEVDGGKVWLEISKIQINTPIEMAKVINTTNGLSFDKPQENPKWIPDWSSEIGAPGVALIYGHRQWGPIPKVFTNLDDLEYGDEAIVKSIHNKITFEVREITIVDPDEVWATFLEHNKKAKENDKSLLMLITCTPWGTDWQRLIILLEEVNSEPKGYSDYTGLE